MLDHWCGLFDRYVLGLTSRRYSLPSGQSNSMKTPNLLYDRLMTGSMASETGRSGSAEIIQNFSVDIRYFARRKLSVANYKKKDRFIYRKCLSHSWTPGTIWVWVLVPLGLWMFPCAVLHGQRSYGGAVLLLKNHAFGTDQRNPWQTMNKSVDKTGLSQSCVT